MCSVEDVDGPDAYEVIQVDDKPKKKTGKVKSEGNFERMIMNYLQAELFGAQELHESKRNSIKERRSNRKLASKEGSI